MFDPYEELGIPRDADDKAIYAAYREQTKIHHPDAGGDREVFERKVRAKALLLDPLKRKRFDDTGDADENEPDNTKVFVIQDLIGMILHTIEQWENVVDLTTVDILDEVKKKLRTQSSQLTASLSTIERRATNIETVAKRMKRKSGDDAPDLLQDSLLSVARKCRESIENTKLKIARCEDALRLADQYIYDAIRQINQVQFGGFNVSGSSIIF